MQKKNSLGSNKTARHRRQLEHNKWSATSLWIFMESIKRTDKRKFQFLGMPAVYRLCEETQPGVPFKIVRQKEDVDTRDSITLIQLTSTASLVEVNLGWYILDKENITQWDRNLSLFMQCAVQNLPLCDSLPDSTLLLPSIQPGKICHTKRSHVIIHANEAPFYFKVQKVANTVKCNSIELLSWSDTKLLMERLNPCSRFYLWDPNNLDWTAEMLLRTIVDALTRSRLTKCNQTGSDHILDQLLQDLGDPDKQIVDTNKKEEDSLELLLGERRHQEMNNGDTKSVVRPEENVRDSQTGRTTTQQRKHHNSEEAAVGSSSAKNGNLKESSDTPSTWYDNTRAAEAELFGRGITVMTARTMAAIESHNKAQIKNETTHRNTKGEEPPEKFVYKIDHGLAHETYPWTGVEYQLVRRNNEGKLVSEWFTRERVGTGLMGIESNMLTLSRSLQSSNLDEHFRRCRVLCVGALGNFRDQVPFTIERREEHPMDLFVVFYNRWWSRLTCMAEQGVRVMVCSPDAVIRWADLASMDDSWPVLAAAALDAVMQRINEKRRQANNETTMVCVLAKPLWLSGKPDDDMIEHVDKCFRLWFSREKSQKDVVVRDDALSATDVFFSFDFKESFPAKKQALVVNVSEKAMLKRDFGSFQTEKPMRDFEIKLLRRFRAYGLHKDAIPQWNLGDDLRTYALSLGGPTDEFVYKMLDKINQFITNTWSGP